VRQTKEIEEEKKKGDSIEGDKGLKGLSVEFSTGITQVLSEKKLKYTIPDLFEQDETCIQPSKYAYDSDCVYRVRTAILEMAGNRFSANKSKQFFLQLLPPLLKVLIKKKPRNLI
jgi:hypothetical protein